MINPQQVENPEDAHRRLLASDPEEGQNDGEIHDAALDEGAASFKTGKNFRVSGDGDGGSGGSARKGDKSSYWV